MVSVESERRPIFEELSSGDCLELLASVPVGRVALTARALPVVLPVNFALWDGDVIWRSAQGARLHAAAVGYVVAFEADAYDPETRDGWSVMIQGVAQVVTDPAELAQARNLPLEAWALDGDADRYVRLTPNIVSGTRIRRAVGP